MGEPGNHPDLGRRYQREIIDLMNKTFETELPKIQRAVELASSAILAGKKCYCCSVMAHMVPAELGENRVGRPRIFHTAGLKSIETGDFLLTSDANQEVLDLKEQGVTVVGVQNPWVFFAGAPREKMCAAPDTPSIEEVSEFVINTYTPYCEGILQIPEIDVAFLPSGTPTFLHVYWMICAGVTEKLVQQGHPPQVITR